MSLPPQGADLTSSQACAARVGADTMEHVAVQDMTVQDMTVQDMAVQDVAADGEEELSIPW